MSSSFCRQRRKTKSKKSILNHYLLRNCSKKRISGILKVRSTIKEIFHSNRDRALICSDLEDQDALETVPGLPSGQKAVKDEADKLKEQQAVKPLEQQVSNL